MRAAEYVRMSTDLQRYSTANQRAKIREFATERGYEVVRSYVDEGRSGLSLKGREGLQSLLSDVAKGTQEFQVILVYDVSRWGRFQDLDEGAHYEFICRAAGKRVIYCAEAFQEDQSPYSSIVKGLRRVMAGEYSRELSEKVFRGQATIAALGYRTGARAGYGYRRELVSEDGGSKGVLNFGERKAQQGQKVRLILGPEKEVVCVQRIFSWFVEERLLYGQIIARLASKRVPPPAGCQRWTKHVLKNILSNEKYLGIGIYNRASTKLKSRRVMNPEEQWVRRTGAFPAIVDQKTFDAARVLLKHNPKKKFRYELIEALQQIYDRNGRISSKLLDRTPGSPSASTIKAAFKGLEKAYLEVGFVPAVAFGPCATEAWQCRALLANVTTWLAHGLKCYGVTTLRVSDQLLSTTNGVTLAVTAVIARSPARMRFAVRKDVQVQVAVPESGFQDFPWFVIRTDQLKRKSIDLSRDHVPARLGRYVTTSEDVAFRVNECLSHCRPTLRLYDS